MKSRYQGDSLLKTLIRVIGSTYIDKYEYDIAMRNIPSKDHLESIERNMDRINTTVDHLDISINKFEGMVADLDKDLNIMNDKLINKVDMFELARLEEKFNSYATVEKVQKIDNRFVKYARNEFVYELKHKIEEMNENIKLLAPSTFVQEQIESISKEIYTELTQYSTKNNVNELFDVNNQALDELK